MKVVTRESVPPSIAWAIAVSLLLHAVLATALIAARPPKPRPRPPTFRVRLFAAPPGPSAVGVVTPAPVPAPAAPLPPARALPAPKIAPAPVKTPPKHATKAVVAATPLPKSAPPVKTTAPPPAAAGGETGGHGADVANINTGGTEFPYPAYLENVVRNLKLRFHPPGRTSARAEVLFIIQRDGSIKPNSLQIVSTSGNFAFDQEAQGAIEQAGAVKAFGPLPAGFPDDVLPVYFSFDPSTIH